MWTLLKIVLKRLKKLQVLDGKALTGLSSAEEGGGAPGGATTTGGNTTGNATAGGNTTGNATADGAAPSDGSRAQSPQQDS